MRQLACVALLAGGVQVSDLMAQVGLPPGGPGGPGGMQPRVPPFMRSIVNTRSTFNRLPPPAPWLGFPVQEASITDFGAYPLGAGEAGAKPIMLRPPPLAPDQPEDWPTWLATKSKPSLPYQPDRCVLLRHSDRVWFRADPEEPFVPLYFWDKTRSLTAGAAVQVRQSGEFELMLHGGGRIVALGPTGLELRQMDDEAVQIEAKQFTHLRLFVRGRRHEFLLPDGSRVEVPAGPGGEGEEMAQLVLIRADEPGWIAGRATMFNAGSRPVTWHSHGGDVQLEPSRRVTFFLTPPNQVVPMALVPTLADVERRGAVVVCRPQEPRGSTVTWSGARFELPTGTTLSLDPLLGTPFRAAASGKERDAAAAPSAGTR